MGPRTASQGYWEHPWAEGAVPRDRAPQFHPALSGLIVPPYSMPCNAWCPVAYQPLSEPKRGRPHSKSRGDPHHSHSTLDRRGAMFWNHRLMPRLPALAFASPDHAGRFRFECPLRSKRAVAIGGVNVSQEHIGLPHFRRGKHQYKD